MTPTFSVVVPVYNEEAVITESYQRLSRVMQGMNEPYELLFVNDGSRDNTAQMIAEFCKNDASVRLICFSRNFGHMPAITAGMANARGQAVIVIDADLQDPPEVLPEMAKKWREGYDVVYGKRNKRKGESLFKKVSAKLFYRFLRSMTDVDLPLDTGEFRLIDRRVCDAVNALPEKNRYMRGLVSWVGFKQVAVEYERQSRFAGETKYPLRKMIAFAIDAIASFSYKPLRLATSLGFIMALMGFIYMMVILFQAIFNERVITGWASTMVVILLSQGIVLMIMGIVGEYIGRIYDELKGRPPYIIQEIIGANDDDKKAH